MEYTSFSLRYIHYQKVYISFTFRIIIHIRISVEIWVNTMGIVVTMQILYYTIFNRDHHFAAKSFDCEGLQMHFLIHAFQNSLTFYWIILFPKQPGAYMTPSSF